MMKVKHERTADCVVAGFRWHKDGAGVGSLLLGLYDDDGVLHHVGVASGFTVARRRELVDELEPLRAVRSTATPGRAGRRPAPEARAARWPNRWNARKDLSWEPVRPRAASARWPTTTSRAPLPPRHLVRALAPRPRPGSCTYEQLDTPVPYELANVFGTV